MNNYFDKQGNYINCENLSLAEIYHRAFALGVESTHFKGKIPCGQVVPDVLQGWRYEDRPQAEWIPVSERLPTYTGLYLISVDDVVTVASFTGTYFMHRGGGRVKAYAWQPLPEPYKKGGAE